MKNYKHHYNRKKLVFSVLFCLLFSCRVAYAAPADLPTDMFGNPIDWVEDVGGDDYAGEEILPESMPENPTESSDYTFQEQADVLAQIESAAAETMIPEETGYLSIQLETIPEDWDEGNIKLTLYCGSRREDIWLYRQSGWQATAELPVGTYTFYQAETPSGFAFSATPGTIVIDNLTPCNVQLSAGKKTPSVYINPTNDDPAPDVIEEPEINKTMIHLQIAAGIAVIVLVFGSLLVLRRKRNKDYHNDLLD